MSPMSEIETEGQLPAGVAAVIRPIAAAHGPTAALRVLDPLRRHQLECVLDRAPEAEADVLVIDLPPGARVPADAGGASPVLVLSDDAAMAADQALAGVLRRAASARQIAAAVAALAEGLQVREPREGSAAVGPLTPREVEILARVGDGLSNKAIARNLGISAHTVKYHLEAVFAKLGVRSRAEAVSQGVRRGLIVL
jgi:two-component system, NarL family, nitrate/nitrite response regulator NarL